MFPTDADLRRDLNALLGSYAGAVIEPREMTRAALAHVYARNGLNAKAIQEFEAVLVQEPQRDDVLPALAEALWRDGRHVEAVEVCHRILDDLPNSLKANLIVAAAWLDSPQPAEAQPYLALVQSLDPENAFAQAVFGAQSPLSQGTPTLDRLAEAALPSPVPEGGLHENTPGSPVDLEVVYHREETAAMSDQSRPEEEFEIPDWLQGVGDELLAEDGAPAAPPENIPPADETPDWLQALVSRAEEAAPPGEYPGSADDTPKTRGVASGTQSSEARPEPEEEADLPDWLRRIAGGEEVGVTASAEPAAAVPESGAVGEEMTDWLSRLPAMRTEAAAAVEVDASDEMPGASRGIGSSMSEVDIEQADLPAWLRESPAGLAGPELPGEPALPSR